MLKYSRIFCIFGIERVYPNQFLTSQKLFQVTIKRNIKEKNHHSLVMPQEGYNAPTLVMLFGCIRYCLHRSFQPGMVGWWFGHLLHTLYHQTDSQLQRNQPITRWQILDFSKLKEFADYNFRIDENARKFSKWLENTVGKGEIARYEQFLLFPQCFQRLFPRGVKRCHCVGMG